MIGIAGGAGPYAGLDLLRKVFDHTLAGEDQAYPDAILLSLPSAIPDRTEYLLDRVEENPARAFSIIIGRLEEAGATVAGIPCNTAHAERIFRMIREQLGMSGARIRLLHMVEETVSYLRSARPEIQRIGVLSTTGTYRAGIYRTAFESAGVEVIRPTTSMQDELIHPAVYHPAYGIKSTGRTIAPQALRNLRKGLRFLRKNGAEAVVLGCTEIPLAFSGSKAEGLPVIDPGVALARALIRETCPGKLKPMDE